MRIKKVHIKNFRSIKDLEFEFPEFGLLVLVGANNAGKSNIVKAINNILGETWWGKDVDPIDFYMRNPTNNIEIKIEFDDGKKVEYSSQDNGWPKYYDEAGDQIYPSRGNIKEDFPCTYLPAQRNISQALSFHKWALMGKIAQSFNRRVKQKGMSEEVESKFKEVMDIFDKVDEFRQFKEDFKSFFDDLQPESMYEVKVDFKPFSPLNYFKTINILAKDEVLGNEYDIDLEELGEGTKNFIILSLLRSYAKNFKREAQGLLIIEEPEIYLHPHARRHLLQVFKDIVKDSNIQIIITTHSASFVETEHFDNIGLVRKTSDKGTELIQVSKQELVNFSNETGASGLSTVDNITEFYAITSNERLKEAFFAKYLILVEGETEELSFPVLFKMTGIDIDRLGISVLAVSGKSQLPKYWRLFFKFQIPLLVVLDNDIDKPEDKRNNDIIAECFQISKEEIENIENGIYRIVFGRCNQPILVFNKNIEHAIKADLENNGLEETYKDLEDESNELRLRKPQKMRYILRRLLMNEEFNFVPEFMSKVKEIVYENNCPAESTGLEISEDDLPF